MRIVIDPNALERIPGYTRVSRSSQIAALDHHFQRLEKAGCTEIYYDVRSRSREDRDGLNEILNLIASGQIRKAMFLRIDRMTDSPTVLERAIKICLESNVQVVGIDDNIDFSTVGGRLQARIMCDFARAEVERLTERVRAGWANVRRRQQAVNPPFGYLVNNGRHQLDHTLFLCLLETREELSPAQIGKHIIQAFLEQKTLRLALREINTHYGIYTFAHDHRGGRASHKLFRFSPGGLRTWLTNPVLRGHLGYRKRTKHKEIIYNTHPDQVLLTSEQFQQIEDILAHNSRVRGFGTTALKYPCSGLVYCGECRAAMYSQHGQKNYHRAKRLGIPEEKNYYFQCRNWRQRSCSQKPMIRMEIVESAVIAALITRAGQIAQEVDTQPEVTESLELKQLRSQLEQLEAIPGHNDAINDAKQQLRNQIHGLELQQQSQTQAINQDLRDILTYGASQPEFWQSLPDDQKRRFFRELVDRVVVKDAQVQEVILKI